MEIWKNNKLQCKNDKDNIEENKVINTEEILLENNFKIFSMPYSDGPILSYNINELF